MSDSLPMTAIAERGRTRPNEADGPPPAAAGERGSRLARALLYARTARRLHPIQWLYWPVRRAQRYLPVRAARVNEVESGPWSHLSPVIERWGPGDERQRLARAEDVLSGRFEFLNRAERLDPVDWRASYVGELWCMNLHYFGYALDLAWAYRVSGDPRFVRGFEGLAGAWIEQTVPGEGEAWEPYSVSIRIDNWIRAFLLLRNAMSDSGARQLTASLRAQVDFLAGRVEYHLQGNHLLKNLKALLLGGLFFGDARARRLRGRARVGLWRELAKQVLPDGTHFERAPMYHVISLVDFLEVVDLLRAAGERIPVQVTRALERMVRATGVLVRADGRLHLFNDSAQGTAPDLEAVNALAGAVLGARIEHPDALLSLPDAGYFGFADHASGSRVLVDCGQPGPDCQPGHAHCDLLSFELDLGGRPVVVDSGVRGYKGDPLREYVRSTRAHSTVAIAGREQSEVWSTYRVARRARPLEAQQWEEDGRYRFSGAYRPYHRTRAVHRRTIEGGAGEWVITDRVEGAAGEPLTSYLHLHPDFRVREEGNQLVARAPDCTIVIRPFGVDRVAVRVGETDPAQGWYCPEFGSAVPAPVLEMEVLANSESTFGYRIEKSCP